MTKPAAAPCVHHWQAVPAEGDAPAPTSLFRCRYCPAERELANGWVADAVKEKPRFGDTYRPPEHRQGERQAATERAQRVTPTRATWQR